MVLSEMHPKEVRKGSEIPARGRLDASRKVAGPADLKRDLFDAMVQIANTGLGPVDQVPSMGCSIKWSL